MSFGSQIVFEILCLGPCLGHVGLQMGLGSQIVYETPCLGACLGHLGLQMGLGSIPNKHNVLLRLRCDNNTLRHHGGPFGARVRRFSDDP